MYNVDGDRMYRTDILKQVRKQYGYTVYDMAEKLSITPSFYSQLENKKRRLFYDMAFRISSVFNMKPDELFYTNIKK